jgi:hypothetical protein
MPQTYENKPLQTGAADGFGDRHLPGDFLLTVQEKALVADAAWILSKNAVMEKAAGLMGSLQEQLGGLPSVLQFPYYPSHTLEQGPKISKGENYLGLPYVILDYPRHFSREDVFALRTMMWWGNFFSCTLHVAGSSKMRLHSRLIRAASERTGGTGWLICDHQDEWQHHGEPGYYIPLEGMGIQTLALLVEQRTFFKLSLRIPLFQWDQLIPLAVASYDLLLQDLGA